MSTSDTNLSIVPNQFCQYHISFAKELLPASPRQEIVVSEIFTKALQKKQPAAPVSHNCLVSIILWLLTLLAKLWPFNKRPFDSSVDAALFEHILLKGRCHSFLPLSNYEVLKSFSDFLHKEKGVPEALLKEIDQCKDWAKQLSKARVAKVSSSITKKIESLDVGESCLVPGAISESPQEVIHLLFRVTRDEDAKYSFSIISRDASFNNAEVLGVIGRRKIRAEIPFCNLTEKEVSNSDWWQALLSLQLPTISSDKSSLGHLFKPFLNRQKQVTEAPFHKAIDTHSTIHNIWSFVHDHSDGSEKTFSRRKLRLKLNTLFDFFQREKKGLHKHPIVRLYLEEGCRRILQSALLMRTTEFLSQTELQEVQETLKVIENTVRHATPKQLQHQVSSRLGKSKSFCPLYKCGAEKLTSPQIISQGKSSIPSTKKKKPNPRPTLNTEKKFRVDASTPPSYSRRTLIQDLKSLNRRAEDLKKEGNDLLLQEEIIFQGYHLPFFTVGERKPPSDGLFSTTKTKFIARSIWKGLTPKDREGVRDELFLLAKNLTEAAQRTDSLLPDRVIILTKICSILEYLAIVDEKETGLTEKYSVKFLDTLNQIFFGKRGKSHEKISLYRLSTQQEYDCLEQIAAFRSYADRNISDYFQKYTEDASPGDTYKKKLVSPAMIQILEVYKLIKIFIPKLNKNYSLNETHLVTIDRDKVWGHPFDQFSNKAALLLGEISQGTNKKPNPNSIWMRLGSSRKFHRWMTQEAIVDSPKTVMKKLVIEASKDRWGMVARNSSSKEPFRLPPNLTDKDVSDFLLAIDQNFSRWEILALLKEKPYLLTIPDIRAAFEHRLLDKTLPSLSPTRYPVWVKTAADLFEELFKIYTEQGDYLTAIYVVHLSRSLIKMLKEKEIHVNRKPFPLDGEELRINRSLISSLEEKKVFLEKRYRNDKPQEFELICSLMKILQEIRDYSKGQPPPPRLPSASSYRFFKKDIKRKRKHSRSGGL